MTCGQLISTPYFLDYVLGRSVFPPSWPYSAVMEPSCAHLLTDVWLSVKMNIAMMKFLAVLKINSQEGKKKSLANKECVCICYEKSFLQVESEEFGNFCSCWRREVERMGGKKSCILNRFLLFPSGPTDWGIWSDLSINRPQLCGNPPWVIKTASKTLLLFSLLSSFSPFMVGFFFVVFCIFFYLIFSYFKLVTESL